VAFSPQSNTLSLPRGENISGYGGGEENETESRDGRREDTKKKPPRRAASIFLCSVLSRLA